MLQNNGKVMESMTKCWFPVSSVTWWEHGQFEVNVGQVIWPFINCRYTTFKQHFWFDFWFLGTCCVSWLFSACCFTPVFSPHHNSWFQHLHVFRLLSSGNNWEIRIDCMFQVCNKGIFICTCVIPEARRITSGLHLSESCKKLQVAPGLMLVESSGQTI